MRYLTLCAAILLCLPIWAKDSPSPCRSYFMAMEHDATTVNMNMLGLNGKQSNWYRKDGDRGKYSGVCLVNYDQSGKRIAVDSTVSNKNEAYIESVVGTLPTYALIWEEHQVFVPDNKGGHYAWSANGALYQINVRSGALTPIGPVHDTNRTIFSSSSVSLLKETIKEIEQQSVQVQGVH